MKDTREMNIIAYVHSDFTSKFGIPRQSGLVQSLHSTVVFEPEYRNPDAVRCLDGYSYIWLIWQFSGCVRDGWSPTVRPPRLGGNKRVGVFASRSPFRPNPIGLSSVKLEKIEFDEKLGPVLYISGADIMDGTPVYDIKPYLPYADSHPDAECGFAMTKKDGVLDVMYDEEMLSIIPSELHKGLIDTLSQDPRPQYHDNASRIYGMEFAGFDIRFTICENKLEIIEILSKNSQEY